jgi:hypothetical protein
MPIVNWMLLLVPVSKQLTCHYPMPHRVPFGMRANIMKFLGFLQPPGNLPSCAAGGRDAVPVPG